MAHFACRPGCAACCIAPSISSPIPSLDGEPGLPMGKPAGLPCPRLSPEGLCSLYNRPERPLVCSSLRPSADMCGCSRDQALAYLTELEVATAPEGSTATRKNPIM